MNHQYLDCGKPVSTEAANSDTALATEPRDRKQESGRLQTMCYYSACLIVTAAIATLLQPPAARAQTPVSLQEQLNSQYKTAQMKSGFGGASVVEPGTLLSVQKGGVLSVPSTALTMCSAKFQDNKLHPSVGFCAGLLKNVSSYFQPGNKVYPLKVDVNLEKEKISFAVVACDSCGGSNSSTSMKGGVVFQFPKGYLETANAAAVEDTIGQVFAISSDNDSDAQSQAGQQAQGGPQGSQPATQEQQQAEPQTIQLGQSPDQVVAALDKPEKIVNLGAKQIYVYRDLKVTFIDGKVSDVQ